MPAGPLNDIAQAWDDPQIKARGLLTEVAGRRFVRTPIKLHDTPVELTRGPAEVGEHTREVLAQAGFPAIRYRRCLVAGARRPPERKSKRSRRGRRGPCRIR